MTWGNAMFYGIPLCLLQNTPKGVCRRVPGLLVFVGSESQAVTGLKIKQLQ
jgi:hypothetical protein